MLFCRICSLECEKGCWKPVAERDFSKPCHCLTSSMCNHCEIWHPGLSKKKVREMNNFTSVPVVVRAFDPSTYPLSRDDSVDPEPGTLVLWPDVYHNKTVHVSEPVASVDMTVPSPRHVRRRVVV